MIALIDNKSKFDPVRHWVASARRDPSVKGLLQRVIRTWKTCVKEWHFSLDELAQARPTCLMLDPEYWDLAVRRPKVPFGSSRRSSGSDEPSGAA